MLSNSLLEIINQWKHSQDKIEKSAFDAINQHDKINCLIKETAMDIVELTTKLEAVGYSLEELLRIQKEEGRECKELGKFEGIIKEQEEIIALLCNRIQTIIEEEANENEYIHNLEEEIVSQRDVLIQIEDYIVCE